MQITKLIEQLEYYKGKLGEETQVVVTAMTLSESTDVEDIVSSEANEMNLLAHKISTDGKNFLSIEGTWGEEDEEELDENGCDAGGNYRPELIHG